MATIIYTLTDEAPHAGHVLLPAGGPGLRLLGRCRRGDPRHLAGRRASWPLFPERLTEEQRVDDALAELGELATTPEANIIKLPNVSASMPQLKAAIAELQAKGYALPGLPRRPDDRRGARHPRPLRQGQGQRRQPGAARGQLRPPRPAAVKNYARKHPHSMGAWSADSRTNVATMGADDFRANEQSVVHARRRHPHDPARRRRRHDDRAQGRPEGPRRRGRRRHRHARRRPRRVPGRADRPRQGRGRAVLGAPQGDDDEGQRPDHLRPRRRGRSSRRSFDHLRRTSSRPPACRPTTGSAASSPAWTPCPTATRSGPPSRRAWPTARAWPWSTPTRASPTCTCPATSSSTPRCRR